MSHVFISYVRENSEVVEKLANTLEAQGVNVWLDRNEIKPGEWWENAIRKAISEGMFFIACFSKEYEARSRTYMGEELTLAIDELRQRIDKVWFIPVLLDIECEVPDIGIGRGKTLRSITWIEVYRDKWDEGIKRIVTVINPPPRPGTVFCDTLRNGFDGPEMVVIPSGSFMMGSPKGEEGRYDDEGPQHVVTLSKYLAMGRQAVTVGDFRQFVASTSYRTDAERGGSCYTWRGEGWQQTSGTDWKNSGMQQSNKHPVVCVSWYDVQAYMKWLVEQAGKRYRLPSEAEWEYAARALSTTQYPWGDKTGRNKANCDGCGNQWGKRSTAPVGSFEVNTFGLFDTVGNVWEWVQDCWHDNYQGAPTDGSAWLEQDGGDCSLRVVRGGSWHDRPRHVRSASRYWFGPVVRHHILGFRLARDL